jgi:hypothetical protein
MQGVLAGMLLTIVLKRLAVEVIDFAANAPAGKQICCRSAAKTGLPDSTYMS